MSAGDPDRHHYRIAMVAAKPFPVPQGSQVLVRQTAELLQARGHEVHLVVYGYGAGAEPPGLHIHRAANVPGARKTLAGPSWAKPFQDAALVRTLRHVLRTHTIDVVHAHNYEGLIVALLGGKRPIVYHAHTCMRDELPYFVPPQFGSRRIGVMMDRALPRHADAVIALHDRARDYLLTQGCREHRVAVIPPPLDPALVLPQPAEAPVPEILYTGNLDTYQNLELLRHAMGAVRAGQPLAKLHVATSDSRPCPGADRRTEIHDRNALADVLAHDVVVACPRTSWSGYPIKLVNAMAAGKAIVVSAGAAHGLVHRKTALVVPDGDVQSFAGALLELMGDPGLRRRLGTAAQEAALSSHGVNGIAEQLERLYANALEGMGYHKNGCEPSD